MPLENSLKTLVASRQNGHLQMNEISYLDLEIDRIVDC
jgi:hypothetical protein